MQKCSVCNLPETYETIEFDENGVCNICRQKDFKDEKINWQKRAEMLAELIESIVANMSMIV